MSKLSYDTSIFRDYDIRGIYPRQINEGLFYLLGKAIATYLRVNKIAVGRDTRLSSPVLSSSLIQGILDSSVNVVDLGMISTEMHYFASGFYRFPANIIVSASHNPSEYNGLKIVKKGVVPLHGNYGLPEIRKILETQRFSGKKSAGKKESKDILDAWIVHLLKFVDISCLRPLKIIIDAGNGMGGIAWEKLSKYLPLKIVPLYFKPDGHFPNHLPDPLNENNLAALKKVIQDKKGALGFAIDGDADRLFVLDENGQMVSGTILSALLSLIFLEEYGPFPILYSAVCGQIVPEIIKKNKGIPIRVRVGHSYIKEEMKKRKALFAGEHSGHFYFRDNFFADSSTIAGLVLLMYISKRNVPFSKIIAEFDKYFASGEINFQVANTSDILKKIESKFINAEKVDHLDGLSVWSKDWWFNLRASKTEPLLRINIEADNKSKLKEKEKELTKLLSSFGAQKT